MKSRIQWAGRRVDVWEHGKVIGTEVERVRVVAKCGLYVWVQFKSQRPRTMLGRDLLPDPGVKS